MRLDTKGLINKMKSITREIGIESEYQTISAALRDLPIEIIDGEKMLKLLLHPGIYEEKLSIKVPHIEILGLGSTPEETEIKFAASAKDLDENGFPLGTFRTSTLYLEAQTAVLQNLSIKNDAGLGADVGQAIALSLNCDRAFIHHVNLTGDQDTLFLAPLPEAPIQKNGFLGAELWPNKLDNANIFSQCTITGGVDFIFGGGAAYFDNCLIRSRGGYVTAASTAASAAYGFVFNNCRFESIAPELETYLGRPWRIHAKTCICKSYLGEHIKSEAWHNWNKPEAESNSTYEEYQNFGPGSMTDKRVAWSIHGEEFPEKYLLSSFLTHYQFSSYFSEDVVQLIIS